MEFCPTCGTLLQYELPGAGRRQARFFCPTCPYVCSMENKVKITKKQQLIKKEKEKGIMSEEDKMKGLAKAEETCKQCGNKIAYFMQQQIRSADEASTIKYQCTKCEFTWVENP